MTDRIKVTIYKDGQLLARHNSKQFTDAQELLSYYIDTMNSASTMVELNRIHNMYLGGLKMLQQVSLMDAEERFDWMEAEYKDYFRNVERLSKKEGVVR